MEQDAIASARASKVLAIARLSKKSMINIFYTPTGFFGRSYTPGKDSRSRKHRECLNQLIQPAGRLLDAESRQIFSMVLTVATSAADGNNA
jgi:hypothetical protein